MKFLRFKYLLAYTVFMIGLTLFFVWGCDYVIRDAAKDKTFEESADVPHQRVGLLLGTSKYVSTGNENQYYRNRIDAAAALFHAGAVKFIVVSGDNATKEYNEPVTMRDDLIAAGVPKEKIFLDYAGFRTFDSVVRLREIFSQDSAVVISQKFHNERAIFLAQKEGMHLIGFNAKDVSKNYGFKTNMREKLARAKVFIDQVIGTQPKFLGEKVVIE